MDAWHREIDELHAFFEAYFLGTTDSMDRVEEALADDFTIVGAHGLTSDRVATVDAIRDGHEHMRSLRIVCSRHRLLAETDDVVVAAYVETHELADKTNHRQSTVVFRRDDDGPNGLRWVRVHETWLTDTDQPEG
ncbi:MAG: DUF4440 domain-containing protein [Actinomycetota bacterium]